jgi:hypothetical protein
MHAELLTRRIDTARHDLYPTCVLSRFARKKGVPGDYKPRPSHALDRTTSLLLGPLEPAVRVCGGPEEKGVVEVIDVQLARGVYPGKRAQQPQTVDQEQIVRPMRAKGSGRTDGEHHRLLGRCGI